MEGTTQTAEPQATPAQSQPSAGEGEATSLTENGQTATDPGSQNGEQGNVPATQEGDESQPSEEGATTPDDEGASGEDLSEVYDKLGFTDRDGEKWFIHEEDPQLGTIAYRDVDDVRTGLREKQRHITRQSEELSALQNERRELLQKLKQRESETAMFYDRLPEDQLDAMQATRYLVEDHPEFKGVKSADELPTEEDRRKYSDALVQARAKVLRDKEVAQERMQSSEREMEEAVTQAETYYRDRLNTSKVKDSFGVTNTEEIGALRDHLMRPSGRKNPDGTDASVAEELFNVYLTSGETAADIYLEGIKARFWNDYRKSTRPAPKQPEPSAVTPAKKPETPTEKVFGPGNPPPASPADPGEGQSKTPDEMLRAGFRARRGRRR